jgi:hypothetical protein
LVAAFFGATFFAAAFFAVVFFAVFFAATGATLPRPCYRLLRRR